jgi:ankyrin repeat protein
MKVILRRFGMRFQPKQAALAILLVAGCALAAGASDRSKLLWEAANTSDEAKLEALLAEGADPNTVRDGSTPLMLAATGGRE